MKVNAGTVTAWLRHPRGSSRALSKLREMIEHAAPKAKGTMQYGTPSWHLGGPLFAMSAQKNYMELLVAEPALVAKRKKALGDVEVGTAGFRFKRLADLNLAVVASLLEEAAALRK
jgi:uncharacterized protein YdhG (YjbR/CyaY superfamily)